MFKVPTTDPNTAWDIVCEVRERLVEGDTDEEVVDFVVDRYGEYVLLRPTLTGANLFLWIAGPVLLLVALGVGFLYIRRRTAAPEPASALSAEEKARLKQILDD